MLGPHFTIPFFHRFFGALKVRFWSFLPSLGRRNFDWRHLFSVHPLRELKGAPFFFSVFCFFLCGWISRDPFKRKSLEDFGEMTDPKNGKTIFEGFLFLWSKVCIIWVHIVTPVLPARKPLWKEMKKTKAVRWKTWLFYTESLDYSGRFSLIGND